MVKTMEKDNGLQVKLRHRKVAKYPTAVQELELPCPRNKK